MSVWTAGPPKARSCWGFRLPPPGPSTLENMRKRDETPSDGGRESLPLGVASGRRTATKPPAIVLGGYVAGLGVIRGLGVMGIPTVAVWNTRNEVARVSRYAGRRLEAP